jgi:hypothetical protein
MFAATKPQVALRARARQRYVRLARFEAENEEKRIAGDGDL